MSLKEWLYTGLIVETRSGIKYIVVDNILYSLTGFVLLNECYNNDLTDKYDVDFDIVRIYENKRGGLQYILEDCNTLKLLKEINILEGENEN